MMRNRRFLAALGFIGMTWCYARMAYAAPPAASREVELRKAEELRIRYEGLYREGKYASGVSVAEEACALLMTQLGERSPEAAACLNDLGLLNNKDGRYDEAEELYLRALSLREGIFGPNHFEVAQSLNNLGLLYLERGKYDSALDAVERALAIKEKTLASGDPSIATSLNSLAEICKKTGEYGRAESYAVRALAILENALGSEHSDVAYTLNGLGSISYKQGEHDKAAALYERALSIEQKALGRSHPNIAIYLSNLGLLYREKRNLPRAQAYLEEALQIEEKTLDHEHPSIAVSLNNLAVIHWEQGEYSKAAVLFERGLLIFETSLGAEHPGIATYLANLGWLYSSQGESVKAERYYERALSIEENALGTEHIDVAASLHNLALLRLSNGERASALALFRRALDIEEKNVSQALVVTEESRSLAHLTKLFASTYFMTSVHFQLAPNDRETAELALTTLLRRKGRSRDLAAQTFDVIHRSLPRQHRHLLRDLGKIRSKIASSTSRDLAGPSTEEVYALRVELQSKQDKLWNTLSEHSETLKSMSAPIAITNIQNEIPDNGALLEFVRYGVQRRGHIRYEPGAHFNHYAMYLVFPDRIEWCDLGPAAPIDAQIHSLRDAITRRADTTPHARALYTSIMKPVVDRLGLTTRLFISPDGDLNLVPFDALVDEYDNYLVERFQLHYLTSGRDLLRPWTLEAPADGPVVVVANPSGAELPGTEHEAALLASLFPDAVTMEHDSASETQLRTHERPRILHLATHGTFGTGRPGHTLFDAKPDDDLFRAGTSVFDGLPPTQLDNPMLYSWLELATPPALPEDPSTVEDILDTDDDALLDDGKLTAYEVSGWDLRGTELVTLSACDTAQGTYQQGEGILGLRRAFAIAGAQTQVMSLWKVSDTATAKLMDGYYRRLLAGEGRSEAMRNTQLELLRDPATRHPRDWAAFVVVGEWGPLSSVSAPPKADPPPIGARPRGCQATVGAPSDGLATILILLPALALTRRRRPRERRAPREHLDS